MNATASHRRDPDQTRQTLLEAAYEEIYRHGFQAASLDRILRDTGVTKGALYHHFKNKRELGYAVIEEVIRPQVSEFWLRAFEETEDPLKAIPEALRAQKVLRGEQGCQCGCPLNNLAQEMSPIDEGFRRRVHEAFEIWRGGITRLLCKGQECGQVRADIDPDQTATFVLAAIEGIIGLFKSSQSEEVFEVAVDGLTQFLEALRPDPEARVA